MPVIDADAASRAVVAPGTPGLAQVVKRFGSGVLGANGEIERRALRNLIFSDPNARRDLEALLQPLIRQHMEQSAAVAVGPYVVLEIPLLIEDRAHNRVDRVLVVDVDEATQLERLMARDGSTPDEARAILGAQATRAARLAAADDVLQNTGSVLELRQSVDRLHEEYLKLAATLGPQGST